MVAIYTFIPAEVALETDHDPVKRCGISQTVHDDGVTVCVHPKCNEHTFSETAYISIKRTHVFYLTMNELKCHEISKTLKKNFIKIVKMYSYTHGVGKSFKLHHVINKKNHVQLLRLLL